MTATGQGSVARAADRLARVTVRRPRPHEVPDWGPETRRLLGALTPLERSFVEWSATGLNAAAAYRRAAGRAAGPGPDAARQLGYKIRARPRVRLAIDAALRDRGSAARVDREWLLMKLTVVMDKCEESDRPGALRALIQAVRLIAKLQGFLPYRPPELSPIGLPPRHDVQARIDAILADIRERTGGRAGPPPPAAGPVVRMPAAPSPDPDAADPPGTETTRRAVEPWARPAPSQPAGDGPRPAAGSKAPSGGHEVGPRVPAGPDGWAAPAGRQRVPFMGVS